MLLAIPLVVFCIVTLVLIWQTYRMEQTLNSLVDFMNDKMAEHEQYMEGLNAQVDEIKQYNTNLQEFILKQLLPEMDYTDFKIDCLTLDYHRHIAYSWHLNDKNQKFRPLQLVEKEATLCSLEQNVKERAKQYKTKINLIRPEGI